MHTQKHGCKHLKHSVGELNSITKKNVKSIYSESQLKGFHIKQCTYTAVLQNHCKGRLNQIMHIQQWPKQNSISPLSQMKCLTQFHLHYQHAHIIKRKKGPKSVSHLRDSKDQIKSYSIGSSSTDWHCKKWKETLWIHWTLFCSHQDDFVYLEVQNTLDFKKFDKNIKNFIRFSFHSVCSMHVYNVMNIYLNPYLIKSLKAICHEKDIERRFSSIFWTLNATTYTHTHLYSVHCSA